VNAPVAPVAFSLTVPESWFELDVRPATRDDSIKTMVANRVLSQPELWEHRAELVKVLRRQARDAWDSGAVYCACFVMVLEESVIPGSITVSVIPPPPAGSTIDAIAEELPTKESSEEGGAWMSRSLIELEGIGRVPRSQGVTDVPLPGGVGWVRSIVMHTFVPVDSERLLLVAAASPALDLVGPLLELFDAVTSTLTLVHAEAREEPGIG
jgi:hypothetical protein